MSDGLRNAVQNFPVIHLERNPDSELAEHLGDDLDQFHFVDQTPAADDVYVALIELPVTTFLRTVGPPYGLNLVTTERKGNLALVLHDIARKGYRQVVAQSLFADFRSQQVAFLFVEVSGVHPFEEVTGVEYLEEQLVSLVSVFAQQRGEVLHGGRFERRESVGAEYALDGIEDICAAHHLDRREVARALRNRWFLCHMLMCRLLIFIR